MLTSNNYVDSKVSARTPCTEASGITYEITWMMENV